MSARARIRFSSKFIQPSAELAEQDYVAADTATRQQQFGVIKRRVDGSMVDLNTVSPRNSSLQLIYATAINDRGEIDGTGVPPGVSTATGQDTLQHAFLLIPCARDHSDAEGCGDDTETTAATQNRPAPITNNSATGIQVSSAREIMSRIHERLAGHRGFGTWPRNQSLRR